MARIPLATNSYQSPSLPLSAQRIVNLYPSVQPPDAKSRLALFGTPGLILFGTVGDGPFRGEHCMAGVLYVVSGTTLYRVSSTGVGTSIGTGIGGSGLVRMADNGTQLAIVTPDDSGKSYIFDESDDSFGEITDPDYEGASDVTYLDGYFIWTKLDSGEFFICQLFDGTDIDALDFATAESQPDNLVGCIADHRELWLFGTSSIEVWYNSGATFPFDRIAGAALERGCAAKGSIVKADNSVYWLGDDKIIYRADGYQPVRISTEAIEHALRTYDDIDQCEAFSYSQEGHTFIVFTFPTTGASWVYDTASQLWHERESYGLPGGLKRWRAQGYANCYGKHIVGDYNSAKLYSLDLDTYTENGDPIVREAAGPPIHANGQYFTLPELEVEVESGAGLTTGQGSDPQAMLQISKDGGRTWGNEFWTSLGALGDYRRRARWRRLGRALEMNWRVRISDPIKVVIIAADADPVVG